MLKAKMRWELREESEQEIENISKSLAISPILAALLFNRGFRTAEEARDFLNIDKMPFHSPFQLDGMAEAVERIQRAVENQEKILVFGDYDADGVSSTSVMVLGLRQLGANVDYYVPHRFTEGYGPNSPAFEKAKEQGITLIITVDTGIAAIEPIAAARAMGLEVIVTDHHEPPAELPEASIIINPKKPGCPYPFKGLAGVGVAFKLIHALLGEVPEPLLDLVAVGTISDLVPLVDENRLFAIKGLQRIASYPRHGILALLKVADKQPQRITEDDIGFGIGPRINAAGRMDHARPAIELMLADSADEAEQLAEMLDDYNNERKQLVEEMAEEAMAKVALMPEELRDVIVVAGEDWHEGVIGIVASRLVEAYYRPAIVFAVDSDTGMAKGSARSIEGFDIYQALTTCKTLLPHFGGHPMAAGMSIHHDDIAALREQLNVYGKTLLTPEVLTPRTLIDHVYALEELSLEAIEDLQRLAPYGVGNPKPQFLFKNLTIASIKQIGSNKDHLKFVLTKDEETLDAIGFRIGDLYHQITPDARLSIVGELAINEWNGYRKPQLMIKDIQVPQWQLFDYRGNPQALAAHLASIPTAQRRLICFREETLQALQLQTLSNEVGVNAAKKTEAPYLVLLDLPTTRDELAAVFEQRETFPERIYVVFYQNSEHFFTSFPTREQFKWLYAFLFKKKQLSYAQALQAIPKHKGWSQELVKFMFEVFFELDFATIEKDIVQISINPNKKSLTESHLYVQRQELSKIEELFCYSPKRELKKWFNQFNHDLTPAEEAFV
ncbi:single-stranded-DNA-specific exonuclease RecJ [Pullulanibacillus camelliae]|uniref:Single-stranded-DNA-specific exonuclease RecJ n=1 Tax=Pullulanibacillus camelliae TaxID=1707096 RepID=A0A8J3DUH5_9BACL|nr:single-stranded-DNA-specific exonuclease RecJ [Pullulanibacillus camelliae]GGE42897.1 single-stranded-DNA-specific exonuclease RecJ [Pullulanibacillus camelliae]